MKAVVLAAGEGRRMRPLSSSRSKVMLPVADRPLLAHLLERLGRAGVEEAIVVVNYRAESIRSAFGDGSDLGIDVSYVHQDTPRGTGDAVLEARDLVDEPFLVCNGDVLSHPSDVVRIAEADGPAMLVARVDDRSRYGAVDIRDGRVASLTEKATGGAGPVNAGIYRLEPGIFDPLADLDPSARGEIELTDALAELDDLAAVEAKAWREVGYPWDLLDANADLMTDLETDVRGTVEDGAELHGPVVVKEDARVRSGAYLEGPVIVGREADVGPNCYVRGATVIGPRARVGNACEVKNSILMEDVHAAHLSYVGDSILGRHVNLGAGTITANLRLDEGTIRVTTERGRVDTGRRKLGAILGDHVKTGINASLDVGTILGEGAFVGPGTVARGTHGPKSRIH